MKKLLSIILCFALLTGVCALTAVAQGKNPFTDVKEKDYFYDSVLWALENGITSGMSETTFSPESPCTRVQVVTFLWRAAGSPEPTQMEHPFADMPSAQYYYKAVLWAVEKNITTGLSSTKFGPDSPCTRGQIATFLWRFAGEPVPESKMMPFSDVESGDFCFNAVLWAVDQKITTGLSATQFGPDSACTRGQIVTFLCRYMSTAVGTEPLKVLFQPEAHQMESSQESVNFLVQVKGGVAPYTFQWFVCYDNVERSSEPVTSNEPINILTWEFSDYDFDEYGSIGVYCYVIDASGTSVETEMATVEQYVSQ